MTAPLPKPFKVRADYDVSREFLANMMDEAVAQISHWATIEHYSKDAMFMNIIEIDGENGTPWKIGRTTLLRGMKRVLNGDRERMVEAQQLLAALILDDVLELGDDAVDDIVQMSLFNEVRYS